MVRTVLSLVLVTNDVRQHHFHKQKIYLLRIFPLIQPLFPLRKDYFHQNNIDLHVEIIHCIHGYLTSLVTRTNHNSDNTIQTIDVYVSISPDGLPRRTDFHTTPAHRSQKIVATPRIPTPRGRHFQGPSLPGAATPRQGRPSPKPMKYFPLFQIPSFQNILYYLCIMQCMYYTPMLPGSATPRGRPSQGVPL